MRIQSYVHEAVIPLIAQRVVGIEDSHARTAYRALGDLFALVVLIGDTHKLMASEALGHGHQDGSSERALLAGPHRLQEGIIEDTASEARSLGFTPGPGDSALGLLLLAPDFQERVLGLDAVDGVEPIGERALRDVSMRGSR